MVEENNNNQEKTSSLSANEQAMKMSVKDFIESLFANDNYLCTLAGAKLPDGSTLNINDETRRRLALFADGTLLISKEHRFDGPVLSFLSIAEKKGIRMNPPVYISQNELSTIYAVAERNQVFSEDDEDLARLQMQRDFVNIIKRASSMKVSDVHVVVSDNYTEIFFRSNGIMIKEMEYSREWGDQFVRAAFASADISDANYAQNEFQGAQKLGSTPLRGSKGKLMLPHNVLAIRLQFNPIAFGSQYLVMRILYADDNPDGNDDLLRRDFTINTLCIDNNGEYIDLLNAKHDINNKIIKCVGDANKKIKEDILRSLRAIRFATILDFKLDEKLKKAIKKNKNLLRKLSYYRKKEELEKIFSSSNCKYGLELIKELELENILNIKTDIVITTSSLGMWAQLDVLDIYPFTKNEKETIKNIKQVLNENVLNNNVLYKYGLYVCTLAGEIKNIDRVEIVKKYNNLPIYSFKDIDIKSSQICEILNKEKGPFIKEIYKDLENKILNNKLENNYNAIKDYLEHQI